MAIQLDPALVAGIRSKVPRTALLLLSAALVLPGFGLGGWYLYCMKFSGAALHTDRLEQGRALEVDLSPEMNPISITAGLPLRAKPRSSGRRSYDVNVTSPGESEVLWSGGLTLQAVEGEPGMSVTVGSQKLDPTSSKGLGLLSIREAGTHSFWLVQDKFANDSGFEPDVLISLRRNARSFSLLWGVVGLVMLAAGVGLGALAWPQDPPRE